MPQKFVIFVARFGLNLMFVKNIVPLLGLKNWRRYVVPYWHTEF